MIETIKKSADRVKGDMIAFCQKIVRIPSMPGHEKECAEACQEEMKKLGYDKVWLDGAGNVIGFVKGEEPSAPKIMLNSHTDHVDPGDSALWPYPPFSGALVDGKIYGRAASDTKGAFAVQVYSIPVLLESGLRPWGDVYVTGVVEEEVGGRGMRYLLEEEKIIPDCVILGEATTNRIYLGHRGGMRIVLTFRGTSVHASAPERGANPHYAAARFLLNLEKSMGELLNDPLLGKTTIAPTLYSTDSTSGNVVPGQVRLVLDCRVTKEDEGFMRQFVEKLIGDIGLPCTIEVGRGLSSQIENQGARRPGGFVTPKDDPFVQKAFRGVRKALDREPELGVWRFATDGRYTAAMGIPTFGFSPCEEELTHTYDDHVKVALMEEALSCYPLFLLREPEQR